MEHDEKLKRTQFFVEADRFAQRILREKHKDDISWETDLAGFSRHIGNIKKRPIYVDFSFAKIGNKNVCFYWGCSELVDHKMIEEYLEKEFPVKYDNGTRRAMVDSGNFHNCYHFCNEK